jgi:cellulose synthase operon protein C
MSDTPQQDLSQLEMAFASDPKAFVPLTNAYLQLGRYMEAMVVCKKGIKAQPDSNEGRLLLARVYAEQGKTPKAIDEVKGLLEVAPQTAPAHFLLGQLLEKSGRFEDAIESYKETIRQDRSHEEAKAALKAKGVDFDPGPSPEEVAAQKAAEEAAERARLEAEAAARAAEEAKAVEAAQRAQQAKAAAMGAAIHGQGQAHGVTSNPGGPRPVSPVAQQMVDPAFAALYAQNQFSGYSGPQAVAQGSKRLTAGFTFGLGALLLVTVVGIIFGLRTHRKQQDEVLEYLKQSQALVKKDTANGHRKALEYLQSALKIDSKQELALGQYAYSLNTLLDRGMRDTIKDLDKLAADAATNAGKRAKGHVLSVAARMVAARIAGSPQQAVDLALDYNSNMAELPVLIRVELGRSYAALGKIQEMVAVADTVKDLSDPAALAFAGEAYRRVGETFKARRSLDGAVKNELDHDVARALRALLVLEQDDVVNLAVALDDVTVLLDLGKDAVGAKQRGYATLGRAVIGKRVRDGKEVQRDIEAAKLLLRNDPEMPLFEAKQAKDDKKYDEAKKLLDDAIKLDKFRLAPYLLSIEVGARSKKFEISDAAYKEAKAIFGDNLELGLAWGQRLLAEGKSDAALTHLTEMLKTLDLAEVHRDIGKVYMVKGNTAKAVESLKKAGEKAGPRGPGIQANVYTWLGRALAQAGDHEQAAESYSQALAATSEFPATYYWLGVSFMQLNKNDGAKDAFQRYLVAEPNGIYAEDIKRRLSSL